MLIKLHRFLTAWLFLALLAAGCSFQPTGPGDAPTGPSVKASETISPQAVYTAAAETIVAQLTMVATGAVTSENAGQPLLPTVTSVLTQPASDTPIPSETLLPSATPTQTDTPTPTLSPTPSITPTNTLPASPTAPSGDPKNSLGAPNWSDDFNSGQNWPLYNDEHVEMQVRNGALEMTTLAAEKWESWMLSWPVLTDFYLELTATPQDCSGLDRYGLLARSQSASETYVYTFSCDGQYALRTWDGEQFTQLVPWTPNSAIVKGTGASNRLGFWARGATIRLYANGALLVEVTDSTYSDGSFGLSIGSPNTNGFTVQFDQISYWILR